MILEDRLEMLSLVHSLIMMIVILNKSSESLLS